MKRPLFFLLSIGSAVTAAVVVAACGGGGSGGSTMANGPSLATPTPTPSPISCAAAHFAAARAPLSWRPSKPALVPVRIGPGPATRVCPQGGSGHARCMAWIRLDVSRSLQSGPGGYSPADLQSAYNLTSPSEFDGSGQIVAVVDAYDDPRAESDLATYRLSFALPVCATANGCFLKVNQAGMTEPLPKTDPSGTGGWEGEESLDLDMVSGICPNCRILLVEANSDMSTDLYVAEDTAATACGANVISNSWNASEYPSETGDETHFNHAGVMITVSAGDSGYAGGGTGYPSSSQYVTSVGGTSLHQQGSTWTESVWDKTGSLCSQYIVQPSWQTALGSAYTDVCSRRIDNDVAADADPNTGVAVFDTYGGKLGCSAWCVFGGTSVSAPIIAAVYALAENGASLTYGSYSYSHTSSLVNVTTGSNGSCGGTYLCTGAAGYNGPTGNGAPNGIGAF